jgi:hypothetical protein
VGSLAVAVEWQAVEVKTMSPTNATPRFQVGDRVRILHSDNWTARIVEFRGPLGSGGKLVYRARVPNRPKPIYIELLEDQLVAISPVTPPKVGLSEPPKMPKPVPPKIKPRKRPIG